MGNFMYLVFSLKKIKKGVIDSLMADDIVGRQSINFRDGPLYGLPEDELVLIIEGSQDALSRVKEIAGDSLSPIPEERSRTIYEKFRDEEKKADEGLGFIFGE
jgi:hypothetical protein